MDHLVYPGHQPLGPREFVDSAIKLPFEVHLKGETWQKTRQVLNRALEDYLGMYDITLGKLLDGSVEFILHVEPNEVDKAKAIIDHLGKSNG